MATPAQSGSQDAISRNIDVESVGRITGGMRKEAEVRGFTIYCDEGIAIGGDNSAPPPLAYFASSLMF